MIIDEQVFKFLLDFKIAVYCFRLAVPSIPDTGIRNFGRRNLVRVRLTCPIGFVCDFLFIRRVRRENIILLIKIIVLY